MKIIIQSLLLSLLLSINLLNAQNQTDTTKLVVGKWIPYAITNAEGERC